MFPSTPSDRDLPEEIHRCRLLIDGYNLLFGLGLLQHRRGDHRGLQRARDALVSRIASRVPDSMRELIWIVFDALDGPEHLLAQIKMQGIQVFFSRGWLSADEMLQALIGQHANPKQLIVISSDHAVQRKAQARGATPFDSDVWEQAAQLMIDHYLPSGKRADPETEKDTRDSIPAHERDEWLRKFGFPTEPES
jgi:predicted RNA-binding protein with PIN domain